MLVFGSFTGRDGASPTFARALTGGVVIFTVKASSGDEETSITSMEVTMNLPRLLSDDEIVERSSIATSSFIKANNMGEQLLMQTFLLASFEAPSAVLWNFQDSLC